MTDQPDRVADDDKLRSELQDTTDTDSEHETANGQKTPLASAPREPVAADETQPAAAELVTREAPRTEDDDGDEDDGDDDDDEEEDEDDDEEEEDEDEEPRLKYARLTQNLSGLYRNGDATSAFLVGGDKMVCRSLVRS